MHLTDWIAELIDTCRRHASTTTDTTTFPASMPAPNWLEQDMRAINDCIDAINRRTELADGWDWNAEEYSHGVYYSANMLSAVPVWYLYAPYTRVGMSDDAVREIRMPYVPSWSTPQAPQLQHA